MILKFAKEVSEKYTLLSDFKVNDIGILNWIQNNYELTSFCPHLTIDIEIKKPIKQKWSIEKALKKASKYSLREDFRKKDRGAAAWAERNNLFDFVCSHMEQYFENWTFEKIQKLALECSSRYDFEKKYKAAYIYAGRHNILDKVCSHMDTAVSGFDKSKPAKLYYLKVQKNKRTVYKVGITNHSVEERFRSDMKYITVLKVINYKDGAMAKKREGNILKKHSDFAYQGRPILKSGNTELFNFDVLGFDR